ncbi:MAG TPA: alkaline phosphatase D family protein, partial [Tahibacter sp.]|nr:alkaline phosphatase D family protein [Tahibacter sp.]
SYGERVRRFESDGPLTGLDDYRARHAWYKLDRDLQAAHAACAWLPVWDDHEVGNDYAANLPMNDEPADLFAIRRAGAYRAWLEHMPVRAACGTMTTRIHRRVAFGALAELSLLDDRQYRDAQPCVARGGGYAPNVAPDCAGRNDPSRSLLGDAQERWLRAGLSDSRARWNLVGQQTLIAPFASRNGNGATEVWSDGWDGYPASRTRLIDHVASRRIPNVVTFGGDVHAFYVTDLKRDFADERAPAVATEFVTGSLTTGDVDHDAVVRDLPLNPHVRAFEGRWRGWLDARISPDHIDVAWCAIDDARNPDARASTLATFRVNDGVAGIAS